MKVCFKCGIEKDLNSFYKHSEMKDGHLNKCKTCTKIDTANRTLLITSTPEGLELERKRQRDKYKRLNYKEKQKIWDKDKPWKNSSKYKGLSKKFKTPKGIELHHWNYNDEYLEDVFVLERSEHRKSHTFMSFDYSTLCFKDLDGNLLNTKENHLKYLLSKGINFKTII